MKARAPSRIAATLAALLLLSHCAQAPVGGDRETVPPPGPREVELGAQAQREVLKEYARLEHAALQAYVTGIGQRLARHSPRAGVAWQFSVLDSADANAFSLPDGQVYISRGILPYLDSEAGLAAVIAHEIGHVSARHGVSLAGAPAAAGLGSVLVPEAEPVPGAPLLRALAGARTAGYGRESEREADRIGAACLEAAGYDPQAMADAADRLRALAAAHGDVRDFSPGAYHAVADSAAPRRRLRSRAAPAAPAADDAYLRRLVGLAVGDSAEQGVLRDNRLLHARLGLTLQFPPGWQVRNRADRVVATNPAGDALLELQAGPKRGTPLDTLQKAVRLDPGTRYDSGRLGGQPAAFAAGAQGGRPVVVAAVVVDGAQYLIAGMTRDTAAYERERSALRAAINSFRELTPAEKEAARAYTLRLATTRPGQTMATLARQSRLGADGEPLLRLMNGLHPDGEPEPGRLLKIVE